MSAMPPLQLLDASSLDPRSGLPLHQQVYSLLQGAVETHFEDGQTFWTEKLLVERLGVSRITVRRALAELTREGVLIREALRGSTVRKVAVATLGVVFDHVNSDFVAEMLEHLTLQCVERDFSLNLYPSRFGNSAEELTGKIKQPPSEERILVLVGDTKKLVKLCECLISRNYRVVALHDCTRDGQIPYVVTDSGRAMRLAVEHLIELGHERITFLVNEPPDRLSSILKIEECRRLFEEKGLSSAQIVESDPHVQGSFEKAYQLMPSIWHGEQRPTAIFTASDPGAWAALRWFAENGISVPDQVSVVGYEGVKPDAFTHPPLTTIAHPLQELARCAVDQLWSPLREDSSKQVRLNPHLVLRQSTGPAPVSN